MRFRKEEYAKILPRRLYIVRCHLHLTQKKMAEIMSLSAGYYGQLERKYSAHILVSYRSINILIEKYSINPYFLEGHVDGDSKKIFIPHRTDSVFGFNRTQCNNPLGSYNNSYELSQALYEHEESKEELVQRKKEEVKDFDSYLDYLVTRDTPY